MQNTGGKTAALKALGLAALMAKAGLYLPTPANEGALLAVWMQVCLCCTALCMSRRRFVCSLPVQGVCTPAEYVLRFSLILC